MKEVHEFMNTTSPKGKNLSLGLDNDAQLYVNNEKVITQQKIKLQWWVDIAIVLGALGAFAEGLIAILNLYK